MIFSRAWFALMRRNFIYRRRNWIGTLLEIILPMFFVWILVLIKNSSDESGTFASMEVPAFYPPNNYSFTPFSFRDYVTAMQAKRRCVLGGATRGIASHPYTISGISDQGQNWMVPLVKCNSFLCEYEGQDATPFCEYGSIGVSASSPDDVGGAARALNFRDWLYERYPVLLPNSGAMPFEFEFVQVFDDSQDMDAYVTSKDYGMVGVPKLAMGIVWQGDDPKSYIYSLRQNSTNYNAPEEDGLLAWTTPDTARLFSSYARTDFDVCVPGAGTPQLGLLGYSCTGQYLYNGVLTFQRLVGDYILDQTGARARGFGVAESGVQFVQFPTKPYWTSGFYASIEDTGPIMVMLGILFPVASMIGFITREKELRQKELMKMMSVTESDIGWSWYMTFFVSNLITTVITSSMSTQLYENSEAAYLYAFWLLTFNATTVFAMTIASLTSKASRGILIGLLVYFLGIFMTIAIPIDYREDDGTYIGLISIHPVAAFSYGLQEIGRLEDQGTGLQSFTIDYTDNPSGYTFTDTIRNLIISSAFWGIMTWYLNRVIEPDYGQALPLWFPFQLSYWLPGRVRAPDAGLDVDLDTENVGVPVEPVSDSLKRQEKDGESIEVKGLRKSFGEKLAVDGLTLSMFKNQITCLLGPNGSGKTTTINILTGAMAPTDGYATVVGKDIRFQMEQIRQDIGICLQHDCLFPNLTVREHVQFFSRLKGLYSKVSHKEAEKHVDEAIKDVALSDKRNTLSKNLSGGMQRKLSVAIAFCGGSKVVLLDEPTSGMDPFARRFTWDVIRQYRQNRCIILTTHFMDEADILGDRIAIMADGHLRCVGSSLFLKKTYGVGYQLMIEKRIAGQEGVAGDVSSEPSIRNGHEMFLDEGSNGASIRDAATKEAAVIVSENSAALANHTSQGETSDERLQNIVISEVEEATLLSNAGSEITFQLPMKSSSKFPQMFDALDREIESGAISSYGVSITTLDEVFQLVARGEESKKTSCRSLRNEEGRTLVPRASHSTASSVRSRMDLSKDALFTRHLRALFKKRAANFRRDKKAWLCTTILPSLFVCIGFIVFTFAAPERNLDPVTLDLGVYNTEVSEPRNPIVFNSPANSFLCQPGQCPYQTPAVLSESTNEFYYFCGTQARFLDTTSLTSDDLFAGNLTYADALARIVPLDFNCSIADSSDIVEWITEDGAVAQPASIENIGEASLSLYSSAGEYAATQYGAIYFTHDSSSILNSNQSLSYNDVVVETCLSRTGNYTSNATCEGFAGIGYVVQYNFTALHVAPLYQALADEALVREATGDGDFVIQATIAPLPLTSLEQSFGRSEDGFAAWFLVVLSFPFIAGAFASFIVKEKQSKAKHLQTVSGVEPTAYWLSAFMWDVLNYQIPLWTVVMMMFAFNVDVLTTSERGVFSGILATLVLYGPASAGFTYCCTYMFTSASVCQMFMVIFGFVFGMGGPMTVFILTILGNDPSGEKAHLLDVARILTWIFRFVPSFSLGKALFTAINIETFLSIGGNPDDTAWSESILGYEVIFLAWQSVVFLWLAVQLDKWSTNPRAISIWRSFLSFATFRCIWDRGDKSSLYLTVAVPDDDDVVNEENRVLSGETNDDIVVISQLTKVYDTGKVAVNNVSLGLESGCFGLLGTNGAGKTTLLGMLTAEFPPTSGDATLAGFSVCREPQKTRRRIGYCPQFDAHFSNLTGREHVELYACIKGIPKELIEEAVAAKLEEVGLSAASDRLSAKYSGGMKRRLSLACATIGQPQIVFLDECTTGVDPVARREIWKMISDMVTGENVPPADRTSVVLTTHSMEECEALCPRIGIMANGRLRCLGSAQHLKSKFGKGFQVELKVKVVDEQNDDFIANMTTLARSKQLEKVALAEPDDEVCFDSLFFDLPETMAALQALTGDNSLSDMIAAGSQVGYNVWKDATSSVGVQLNSLAAFATVELRMRRLEDFMVQNYPNQHVLRERQDMKSRYEVLSEGVRISSIFASIEAHKEELQLADYGVSQTSLEQVFNMHAAEAERFKQGHVDR